MQDEVFNINCEVVRVDSELRQTWGVLVTDSLLGDGKVLSHEANVRAIKDWVERRGNMREMHDKIAAGRAINYEIDDEHHQIWLGTRVSEGAENTWKKIVDGTLRAYSINAVATKKHDEVRNIGGRNAKVTVFDDYVIREVSYVDVGLDPASNENSLVFRGEGFTDLLAEGELEVTDADREALRSVTAEAIPVEESAPVEEAAVRAEDPLLGMIGALAPEVRKALADILSHSDTAIRDVSVADPDPLAETPLGIDTELDAKMLAAGAGEVEGGKVTVVGMDTPAADENGNIPVPVVRADAIDSGDSGGDAAGENSQVAQARVAFDIIRALVASEVMEPPSPDCEDAEIWDAYTLFNVLQGLQCYIDSERWEMVSMATRAEGLAAELNSVAARVLALEDGSEKVVRSIDGVSPVDELREELSVMRADFDRFMNEPNPSHPMPYLAGSYPNAPDKFEEAVTRVLGSGNEVEIERFTQAVLERVNPDDQPMVRQAILLAGINEARATAHNNS